MLQYIVRRIIYMVVLLLVLSFVSFLIIQLPPGDYLSTMIQNMRNLGMTVDEQMIRALENRYGLDQPVLLQYLKWFGNLLQGDMGRSFQWNEEVTDLIAERLALTVTISIASLMLVYVLAVPIGIYSATHPYSLADYVFTVFGFIGLATPNFLLALDPHVPDVHPPGLERGRAVLARLRTGAVEHRQGVRPAQAPADPADRDRHGGNRGDHPHSARLAARRTGQAVRDHRARQGAARGIILFKYPVRLALNPIISSIGGLLPAIVAGETLVSIVLSLPTIGPLLLRALQAQDMYLAGSMVMLLSGLAMLGTLVSDLMLVSIDPRIRFENEAHA